MKKLLLLLALAPALSTFAGTLTISAAASLQRPLEQLAPAFERENPGVKVVFNFGSSGSLEQQIRNGAPIDAFISAANKQIDALEKDGFLVPATRRVIATNAVVLIAPVDSDFPKSFRELASLTTGPIAIGEPKSVPAGQYAVQILNWHGLAETLKNKLVFAKDVRQVLVYVETGNAAAGIVYASDALGSKKVRVVETASAESHDPVTYPGAVAGASKDPGTAVRFLDFLSTPAARETFAAAGFGLP